MGYVNHASRRFSELRGDQFGQSVVDQQIPLDAIVERFYHQHRSVGSKFHGRIITLL